MFRRPFVPRSLAAVALLALAALSACGDATSDVLAAEALAQGPNLTLRVPPEPPADWVLPPGVTVATMGDRTGLVFAPGEEPLTVSLPVPREAHGAGRVVLRVMCDGAFGVGVVLGAHESRIARSSETRRLWKELQFPLTAPLAGAALAAPMRIVRASSELPLVVEAIRFLP